jgi:poly(A) polymerase
MTDAFNRLMLPSLRGAIWLERPEARAVFAALAAAGHEARAVGGAVRNALLEEPVADVDIATPARPDEVMRAAAAAGIECVPTGLQHGTVTLVSGHVAYQITTLRRDVETDGRHARVAFSDDWAADARRRDFTINALYCAADGTVFDPLDGYQDLMQRRVVFIGDARERIREDYLRILRFFRFHAQYAVAEPDRAALEACVHERRGLASLSGERVRGELLKLLDAPWALRAVCAMHAYGLLSGLLGVAPRPGLLERLLDGQSALQASADALLRLSALAVAVEEDADRLSDRLRLSNAERRALIVVDHRSAAVAGLKETAARRVLYRTGGEVWRRMVLAAAATIPPGERETLRRLWSLPIEGKPPSFPLRGADVLALGVPPGPEVGAALRELEDWWIEGDFAADEAALRIRLAQTIRSR